MKKETKVMFWVTLVALPICYFMIAPAVIAASVFLLLLAIDSAEGKGKAEIDSIRCELKNLWYSFDAADKKLVNLEEKKVKAPTVNVAPIVERLDKLETNINAVNLRLGFGELPKSIK